jgi:hypothetical protein
LHLHTCVFVCTIFFILLPLFPPPHPSHCCQPLPRQNLFHPPVLSFCRRKNIKAGRRWLMPVILAIQEAEIRRIVVQSQPGQIVPQSLILKTFHKNRAGGVA